MRQKAAVPWSPPRKIFRVKFQKASHFENFWGSTLKKNWFKRALAPKIFEKLDWGGRRAGGAPEDIRDELSSH